jgi:hypothetical protein
MKAATKETIQVVAPQQGLITVCVLGRTPLLLNRLSEKAKHELLLPAGPKNRAEKQGSLKHDPLAEFRASAHRTMGANDPTLLATPSAAWKGAIRGAALDQEGATKAQIGRLCFVEGDRVAIYGIPQIHMTTVRQASVQRTPDIRTRCIVPQWAAYVTISYVKPMLNDTTIVNLLVAAGFTQGIGDWRPEKGSGNNGQFTVVAQDDPQFLDVIATGGRAVQQLAMNDPTAFDHETEELAEWFSTTVTARGKAHLQKVG